jgi:hypothetical protein
MRPEKITAAAIAATLALVAGSAFAGPDWASIERGRAAKQEQRSATEQNAMGAEQVVTLTLQRYGPRPHYVRQTATEVATPVESARAD